MEPHLISMKDLPSQVRQKLNSLFSSSGIGVAQYYLLLMIRVMIFCKKIMHPDSVTGLSIYYTNILRVVFQRTKE